MHRLREAVYGKGHLHLIACTCYRKLPKLAEEKHRDVFVRLLEQLRVKFRFSRWLCGDAGPFPVADA